MDRLNGRGTASATGIEGVWVQKLAEIDTEGGPVLHMLRADDSLYRKFGEIYFSVVLPGAVKAWKYHRLQTQNFAVPWGILEVIIYDDRENSPSRGTIKSFMLGRPDHYRLLHIPPGLWYGFCCRSEETAILANCADIPHSPGESVRIPKSSPLIPYTWEGAGD
jgi:dTDP-4-dehydrorhamnose 3,5-epimerase and related enzymes